MKIIILSRSKELYSTRRLSEAGIKRGHQVSIVDYLRCHINITSRKPTVYYQGRPIRRVNAVISRIGASNTFYGTAVVRQFEVMGNYCFNPSEAITASRDKLKSLQILAEAGIAMPVTGFANHTDDIESVIEEVGSVPLVMKLLVGTHGKGVVLAETKKAAQSVMSAFSQLDADVLVQEFISESSGTDIRVLVVGDKVVSAMKRTAHEEEFRSNVHCGGKTESITITDEEENIAVKVTKILGLGIAGVDLMRSNRGPLVLEVNSSPGLQGIEECSNIDIASKIIEHIEKSALV